MAGGIAVLLGWLLDVPFLKNPIPGQVSVKANTALAFVLSGLSLWLLQPGLATQSARAAARACAAGVMLIGALTLLQYASGWNLGIDQLLFDEPADAVGTSHPGRMSPLTAIDFTVLGLALLLVEVETRGGGRPAQFLALAAFAIAFVAAQGDAYSANYLGPAYTRIALPTALVFLALSLGVLCARPSRGLMALGRSLWLALAAWMALTALAGFTAFLQQRSALLEAKGQELSFVADLQQRALQRWLTEKRRDAQVTGERQSFVQAVERARQGGMTPGDREQIPALLESLRADDDLRAIGLYDLAGDRVFAAGPADSLAARRAELMQRTLSGSDVAMEDLHRARNGGPDDLALGFVAPLSQWSEVGRKTVGMVYVSIDPRSELYPLLQTLPVSSATTEVVLARREDDDVVFLNPLRARQEMPLTLRIPITAGTTAGRALQGFSGLMQGVDYAGVPVLAATRAIAGSSWAIVVRIALDEVDAPARTFAVIVMAVTGSFLFALGAAGWLRYRAQAQVLLLASTARFRTLVTATAQIVWTTTGDGRMVTDMPEWRAFTGQSIEAIQGYGWADALHPDDRERTLQVWNAAVAARKLYDTEYRIRRHDGEYRWFATRGVPVLASDGSVSEWIGTCSDIHERRHAEEEIRRLNVTLEQHVADRTRQLETANGEVLKSRALIDAVREAQAHFISGAKPHAVFDFLLDALCTLTGSEYGFIDELTRTPEGQPALFARALTNIAWNDETRKQYDRFLTGELMFTNMTSLFGAVVTGAAPVIANDAPNDPRRSGGMPAGHPPLRTFLGLPVKAGGELLGVIGLANRPGGYDKAFVADMEPITQACSNLIVALQEQTRRRDAEGALRRRSTDLAQRTAELETANQDLESFSYSVSHDLRAPLRAIDNFSSILLEEQAARLDDEGKRLLGVIRRNTSKMAQMIDEILAFSRAGRQALSLTTVDMTALAREVFAELKAGNGARAIEFRCEALPPAPADAAAIRQVWGNLLANAIKFTRSREPALIDASGRVEDAGCVYTVRDNGAGFDPQYANKLFGVFQRLHGAAEFEGSGIGLAIAKRIVDKHGGRIWAEGESGKGAAFHFALPQHAAPITEG